MKKLLLLIAAIMIVVPFNVDAALNPKIILNCDKTELKAGEKTTCKITGKTDEEISGVQAFITLGANLTRGTVTVPKIWYGDGNDGNVLLLATDIKGEFEVATFEIIVSDDAKPGTATSVSLTGIQMTNQKTYQGHELSDVSLSIKIVAPVEPENPDGGNGGTTPENPDSGNGGTTPENPDSGNGGTTPENPDDSDEDGKQDNPNTGDLSMYAIGTLAIIIAGVGIIASKKIKSM